MSREARDLTTDEDIERALEGARQQPDRPLATAAEYNAELDLVILRLDRGGRLVLPREQLQDLQDATASQLAEIEIYSGVDIAWPQLDVDLYLPYLLEGRYGSAEWMQQLPTAMNAA